MPTLNYSYVTDLHANLLCQELLKFWLKQTDWQPSGELSSAPSQFKDEKLKGTNFRLEHEGIVVAIGMFCDSALKSEKRAQTRMHLSSVL